MNADARPSFWKRLLLFIIRFVVIGVLVLALATIGYLVIEELQASLDRITARISINRRDLEELRSEVDLLSADAPGRQRELEALQDSTNQLDRQLGETKAEMSEELEMQRQLLAALEEQVAMASERSDAAVASSQTASEDTAALGTALVALQSDLNDTNGRIDALGGEIDEMRAGTEGLSEDLSDISLSVVSAEEAAENTARMEQTLALFHVWELVTRARFRLAEDNIGLAIDDVERAFRAVDGFIAEGSEEDVIGIELVRTRLALTFTNLPDDPASAIIDLEGAWDELENVLSERILPTASDEISIEQATPSPGEATEQATPVPTPSP